MAKMNYAARRAEDLVRERGADPSTGKLKPLPPKRKKATPASPRQIRAKYNATCSVCGELIAVGEPILWAPNYAAHVIHHPPKHQARTRGGLTTRQATIDDYDRMTPRSPANRHGTSADTRYL